MQATAEELQLQTARDGFAIIERCIPQCMVDAAITAVTSVIESTSDIRRRDGSAFAFRNALTVVPALRAIADCVDLRAAVAKVVGPAAFVTRAILFDKNPNANWAVPWHQDVTIAVQNRIDTPGFGPWSQKGGVIHVQPLATVLERMITARVHLDDCDESNGALRVIPTSHQFGFLTAQQIEVFKSKSAITCTARAGDVLLMKPLLLHASSPAKIATKRRVLHLEFASEDLVNGLKWNRA